MTEHTRTYVAFDNSKDRLAVAIAMIALRIDGDPFPKASARVSGRRWERFLTIRQHLSAGLAGTLLDGVLAAGITCGLALSNRGC